MDSKNNIFKRLKGILLSHRETLQEIADSPTNILYIFILMVAILSMFTLFLLQIPTGLNSILIIATNLSSALKVLLYFVVMAVAAVFYFIILLIIFIIGGRLRRSRQEHRKKKVLFNLYVYSLTPVLILATQIPFIMILGGHYSLFNLQFFFFFLIGLIVGWHATILYRGIQTNSDLSSRRTKLLVGIYIGIIGAFTAFCLYAIHYINFDISWLGTLA